MSRMLKKIINNKGFTLTELLVSVIIAVLIIIIVGTIFVLNQKVLRKSNTKAELTQNSRITLDLMAREIRQANKIITSLPPDDSDPDLVAHEIKFEDGHTVTQIQYIRYYLDSTDLKRQIIVYYFDTDSSTYVYFDDFDAFGPATESILEDKIISENIYQINLYGIDNINIELTLQKKSEQVEMKTIINPRNT